jgi:plasmid stabilization system protein ParE
VTQVAHRTEAANLDLVDIGYQIGIESGRPAVASRTIDELIDCCESLAKHAAMGQMGTPAEELGMGVRLFHLRRWVIVFRYIDDGILVLRIVDGAQDYLSWSFSE